MRKLKPYIPLAIIVLFMVIFYVSGLYHYLSFAKFRQSYLHIKDYMALHPFLAPLFFMLLYIAITALSIPVGATISILGGILFPQPQATIFVTIGMSLGSLIIFLAARVALKDMILKKGNPTIKKLAEGFKKHDVTYLLFLRIVPIFHVWLLNIALAFFQIRPLTFFWTTALGMLPVEIAYTMAGRGLVPLIESEQRITLRTALNFKIIFALVALGFLCLVPLAIQQWKKRKKKHAR